MVSRLRESRLLTYLASFSHEHSLANPEKYTNLVEKNKDFFKLAIFAVDGQAPHFGWSESSKTQNAGYVGGSLLTPQSSFFLCCTVNKKEGERKR